MKVSSEEFQAAFLSFQNDLKSYILRVTGSREDAEDIAQDTYVRASQSIQTFKGKSSIKAWVFKIASNLMKDHFRAQKRWSKYCMDNASADATENPSLIDKMKEVSEKSHAGTFEIKEHINFCFTCIAKTLPIEHQVALLLKDVYAFKVREMMDIMQLTEGKVKHLIADARSTMIHIFEKRCALVSKNGVCYQCSELNGILNPKQEAQSELNRLKMYKEAKAGKTPKELYNIRAELVRQIDPLNSAGTDLHTYFLSLMPSYSETSEKREK